MSHMEPTFTIAEAAQALGCSPWTLRDRVSRGEVPHHRRGKVKGVYFTPEDLRQIRASQARPVAPAAGGSGPAAPAARIPDEFARLKAAR